MGKPWNCLRHNAPIGKGEWATEENGARFLVTNVGSRTVQFGTCTEDGEYWDDNVFFSEDLRQLAEFCTELADQLDAKP